MKTGISRYFTVNIFIFLVLVFPAHADDKLLQVALDHWPPYIDKYHPDYGLATELVTTALARAGYKTSLTVENWTSALEGTRIGVYDVIIAGWHTTRREELYEFSKPYLYNEIKFIKRRDKPFTYNSFTDLQGLLIGVVENYAYSPEFDNSNRLIKVPSQHLIQNLSLLQQGKIDLTLDDKWAIRYQITNFMPGSTGEFEFLEKPLAVRSLHLLVSRDNPDHKQIVAEFDKAIVRMKSDGSFDAIVKKYHDELRSVDDML